MSLPISRRNAALLYSRARWNDYGGDGHQLSAFRGGQFHAYYQGWPSELLA